MPPHDRTYNKTNKKKDKNNLLLHVYILIRMFRSDYSKLSAKVLGKQCLCKKSKSFTSIFQ